MTWFLFPTISYSTKTDAILLCYYSLHILLQLLDLPTDIKHKPIPREVLCHIAENRYHF